MRLRDVPIEILEKEEPVMRWNEDGVVHEVTKFWDDDYPEIVLRCGRSPNDTPTIGAEAEQPAVSCLLCIMAALDEEADDIPW